MLAPEEGRHQEEQAQHDQQERPPGPQISGYTEVDQDAANPLPAQDRTMPTTSSVRPANSSIVRLMPPEYTRALMAREGLSLLARWTVSPCALVRLLGRGCPEHFAAAHRRPAHDGPSHPSRPLGHPHVDAASDDDAWFGLGFCHAQDRAFQLETLLRAGRGTLSAMVGPAACRSTACRAGSASPGGAAQLLS